MAQNAVPTTSNNGSCICIRGAREHNLQEVHVDIPRDRLVVITGPSGSGKSSLAFDTLYAEGMRQYVESLSVSARQFLDQVSRPDVDVIEGLQPTLCIDQRPGSQNPRSTVGTVTELYDYLRLLYARLGEVSCYRCHAPIRQQSVGQIVERLAALEEGTKTMIMAPLVRGRRGTHKDVLARIRKAGLVRVRVDGLVCDIDSVPVLAAQKAHQIDAVIDRVIIRPGIESRLADSVRLAIKHGDGLMTICYLGGPGKDRATSGRTADQNGRQNWRDEFFSTRYACPDCQISYAELEPRTFSFNSPYGACPVCEGLGTREQFDLSLVIPDRSRSLGQGAVMPWDLLSPAARRKNEAEVERFLQGHGWALTTRLSDIPDDAFGQLVHGDEKGFRGILVLLEKEYVTTTAPARLSQLGRFRTHVTCPACGGSRLRPEAVGVRVAKRTIHQIVTASVAEAADFFEHVKFRRSDEAVGDPLRAAILSRLRFLCQVGLDYLTLDRAADTLSGGEFQRVRLASSIGSGLVGVCYVLDEPSIGLHQRDNHRLIDALRGLKSQGNTVLVVEHDAAVMRLADHLIDMGPGAGRDGGRIVAQGTPEAVMADDASLTGQYLASRLQIPLPAQRRRTAKARSLTIQCVRTHNLKDIDVRIPLGALVCVTGVSGSGKSSLVNETLAPALLRRLGRIGPAPGPHAGLRGVSQVAKVVPIDQSPIGRSPRSNPATYSGVFDEVRKVFAGTRDARQRGFRASRFSFNNKEGRCGACQGHGVQKIEMSFLPDLFVTCDRCAGARFNRQTLQAKYRGKSIADVLEMSVREALDFFENFVAIARVLQSLARVGLGYLPLGQSSTTLSGGEAQRIKLATELARIDSKQTLYLLDEPTTGLHFDDIRRLLDVLQQLVDNGNTVLVIEHNLDVIKCADWIIDLGPEGGDAGGYIVTEGTPEQVAACDQSHTGRYLLSVLPESARTPHNRSPSGARGSHSRAGRTR